MKNEELPCGVLALRSQILHSSFHYQLYSAALSVVQRHFIGGKVTLYR